MTSSATHNLTITGGFLAVIFKNIISIQKAMKATSLLLVNLCDTIRQCLTHLRTQANEIEKLNTKIKFLVSEFNEIKNQQAEILKRMSSFQQSLTQLEGKNQVQRYVIIICYIIYVTRLMQCKYFSFQKDKIKH